MKGEAKIKKIRVPESGGILIILGNCSKLTIVGILEKNEGLIH